MKKLDRKITAVPHWEKSTKEVWNERFANLSEKESVEPNDMKTLLFANKKKFYFSIAATILLLLSITSFVYTTNIEALPRQICAVTLPDGSEVKMAPGSDISYKPLWWMLSPGVKMNGEALFSGHHAKGFTVTTKQGTIEVLGTSFNARNYDSQLVVTCIDGKIKVKSKTAAVELTANMEATIKNERITTEKVNCAQDASGWTTGMFSFYNKPLNEVLKDVERYYKVRISSPKGTDTLRYTGEFTQEKSVEEVLLIIGQPYGITFKVEK